MEVQYNHIGKICGVRVNPGRGGEHFTQRSNLPFQERQRATILYSFAFHISHSVRKTVHIEKKLINRENAH